MEEENRLTRGMFGKMKGQVVIENNQDVPVMFMACLNPTMGYGGDVSGRTIALAPPAQGHITMIIIIFTSGSLAFFKSPEDAFRRALAPVHIV